MYLDICKKTQFTNTKTLQLITMDTFLIISVTLQQVVDIQEIHWSAYIRNNKYFNIFFTSQPV